MIEIEEDKQINTKQIEPMREYKKTYSFNNMPIAKYTNKEDLQNKISEYFNQWCTIKTKTIKAKDSDWNLIEKTIEVPIPTITWLALYLWFNDRSSLYNYASGRVQGDGETIDWENALAYTAKKAMTFIEREYEEMLQSSNVVWAIFALKNMWRSDRLDINQTTLDVNQLWNETQRADKPMQFGQVIAETV